MFLECPLECSKVFKIIYLPFRRFSRYLLCQSRRLWKANTVFFHLLVFRSSVWGSENCFRENILHWKTRDEKSVLHFAPVFPKIRKFSNRKITSIVWVFWALRKESTWPFWACFLYEQRVKILLEHHRVRFWENTLRLLCELNKMERPDFPP